MVEQRAEREIPTGIKDTELFVGDFTLLNREVAELLQRFGQESEEGFKFTPEFVTYYPHRDSMIMGSELVENLIRFKNYGKYLRDVNLKSQVRPLRIDDLTLKGELTVYKGRLAPLYVATLKAEELLLGYSPRSFAQSKENVGRFISPGALAPFQHFVWDVRNQDRDAAIFTVDQEGSNWSFHLGSKGWSFEEGKARIQSFLRGSSHGKRRILST